MHRCESNLQFYKWRITWNYVFNPFKETVKVHVISIFQTTFKNLLFQISIILLQIFNNVFPLVNRNLNSVHFLCMLCILFRETKFELRFFLKHFYIKENLFSQNQLDYNIWNKFIKIEIIKKYWCLKLFLLGLIWERSPAKTYIFYWLFRFQI